METEKRFISLKVKHESLEKAHSVAQQQLRKLKVFNLSCNRWVKSLPHHRSTHPPPHTDTLPSPHTTTTTHPKHLRLCYCPTPSPIIGHNASCEQWVSASSKPQSSQTRKMSRGKEGASCCRQWSKRPTSLHTVPVKGSLYGELDIEDPIPRISQDRKWIRETSVDWEVEDFEDTEDGALWYDYGDLTSMYTSSRDRRGITASRSCVKEEDGFGADDPAFQALPFPGSPSLRSPPAILGPCVTTSPYHTAASPCMVPLQRWTTQRQNSNPRLQSFAPVETEYPDSLYCTCLSAQPRLVGRRDAPVVETPKGTAQWSLITVLLVCFAAQLVCFIVKGLLDL